MGRALGATATSILGLATLAGQPAAAQATFGKEEAEVRRLMEDAKYLSAASYIFERAALRAEPRFVRLFTHLLTTKYVVTINFSIFALKDLKKGERVEDYRGKQGTYQFVGGPLDEMLYKAIKKNPESPHLNFALGEYLSRGQACGCRAASPIKDLSGIETPYFLKAHQAGIADDWSLFRLGVHHHGAGRLDDAIGFYKKSLALDPTQAAANYNLASAYYAKKDDKNALTYATKALGKYDNDDLNADTYHAHGAILAALKDDAGAEKSLEQALKLKPWHDQAFTELIALYRRTKQNAKYLKRVQDYIALDYGNTYTFNVYINYLQKAGQTDLDRQIEQNLLALKLADARQNGALYFNLGRMADYRNDKAEALLRYERSLAVLKTMKEPPEGAVAAVT